MKILLLVALAIVVAYFLIKAYKMFRTYRKLKKIFKNNFNQDLLNIMNKMKK